MGPAEAAIRFWMWFWAGVVVLGLIGAIILGGWAAGWWLTEHNVQKDYQVTQQSQQYQDTYLAQTEKDYAQIAADKYTLESDKAQGYALSSGVVQSDYAVIKSDITRTCDDGGKLTQMTLDQLPPDVLRFYRANC